jgi:ornithine cyclodeaminase/alanine dehydrogenase-like protein (mu-crystallin family)
MMRPMSELLVLGADAVRALLPMGRCIDLMAEALARLARGDGLNPLRTGYVLPGGNGVIASMPGSIAEGGFGAKVISVFPGNRSVGRESHQGLVVLFESEHGTPVAVVDAAAITAIRTAAVSGLATRTLARPDASRLALLGSGTQARTHLEAMLAVRPVRTVRAWSPNRDHLDAFVREASERWHVEVEAAPSANAAVEGADLVCTVTASAEPVLHGDWLGAGTHVNAVGSSVTSAVELDADAVARSRFFVDRRESALMESGDLLAAIRAGAVDQSHIAAELGEVLVGSAAGRTNDEEITVFESLGLAVEDLAAAAHVAREATQRGTGSRVDL